MTRQELVDQGLLCQECGVSIQNADQNARELKSCTHCE